LCALAAALALFQAGAALRTLRLPPELAAGVSVPGTLALAGAGAWALIFALLTVTLWRLRPRAVRQTAWALIAFAAYSAARLAVYAQADYDRQRLPVALLALAVCAAVPALYLLRRPSNQPINGDA
jgi:hypothetical protein